MEMATDERMGRCRRRPRREETFVREEREPAFEPRNAGTHEDSHPLSLLVRSLYQRKERGMIPSGQEEEGEDQGIILTSRLTADF